MKTQVLSTCASQMIGFTKENHGWFLMYWGLSDLPKPPESSRVHNWGTCRRALRRSRIKSIPGDADAIVSCRKVGWHRLLPKGGLAQPPAERWVGAASCRKVGWPASCRKVGWRSLLPKGGLAQPRGRLSHI